MTKKPDYNAVVHKIRTDPTLHELEDAFSRVKDSTEKLKNEMESMIYRRTAQIVEQERVGYPREELVFEKFLRREGNTILIKTRLKDKKEQVLRYYSPKLKLWIEGEPEKRADGLYCYITGGKIS